MKWYNNPITVVLSLIIFCPIGFYALYKNERFDMRTKVGLSIATILFLVAFAIISPPKKQEVNNDISVQNTTPIKLDTLTQAQKDSIDLENQKRELAERKQNTISANDLLSSYKANEVKADADFKDKTFYVVGKVSEIRKGALGGIIVELATNQYVSIHCATDDEETASQLTKGQKVTIKGECNGMILGIVNMTNCVFVENL